MIERRARSLFSSNKFAEARFTICLRNYWCRGLIDDTTKERLEHNGRVSRTIFNGMYKDDRDGSIDREGFPLLGYAATQ